MPIQSRWSVPLPEVSVQKWLFGSPSGPLPDSPAFIDPDQPDRFLSLAGLRLWAKKIALGLRNQGLRPGDRVLCFSGNGIFYPACLLGIIMAGGIFTGASPAFTPRELGLQYKDSSPAFVVIAPSLLDVAVAAAEQVGMAKSRLLVFDMVAASELKPNSPGIRAMNTLLASDADAEGFDWIEPEDVRNATCALNYSSGTTGVPKGVEITHFAYVANGEAFREISRLGRGPNPSIRCLCLLPMYHAAAQTTYAVNAVAYRFPTYIMPAFNFEQMLQHVEKYGITDMVVAPPIVQALATSPLSKKYDLSTVKELRCGTAPLAPDVGTKVANLWPAGGVFVQQSWGMTEFTCLATTTSPEATEATGSVGEIMPNVTVKLMDGNTEVTRPDDRGELWLSGPTLMKGYWQNPEATRNSIVVENGVRWLRTGDVGYLDTDKPGAQIFVVDRIKELIKVKGFQVAPAEVEAVLLELKGIVDAGVVGVTIDGKEMPRAYLVKAPGSHLREEDVNKWVEGKLAKYKWLTGGVKFVDGLPRIPSGKILRRVLRETARKEVGTLSAKLS
ncbi:AMP-binding enzyme [Thozetella sp. PMI_491]|nr:AMP-binding enzyme [Thozetella sp. PMI_491]